MRSFVLCGVIVSFLIAVAPTRASGKEYRVSLPASPSLGQSDDLTPKEAADVETLKLISNACSESLYQDIKKFPAVWSADKRRFKIEMGQYLANCVGKKWDDSKSTIHFEFFLDTDDELREVIGK